MTDLPIRTWQALLQLVVGVSISASTVTTAAPLARHTSLQGAISVNEPSQNAKECEYQPLKTQAKLTPEQIRKLAGSYLLTVVYDTSLRRAPLTGKLVLAPTDSAHRFVIVFPNQKAPPEIALWGYTDARIKDIAPLAVPASSRDQTAPGVQVRNTGALVVGNPITPTRTALDAGVYFFIEHADSTSFGGRWAGGLEVVPLPRGFFCAKRIRTD